MTRNLFKACFFPAILFCSASANAQFNSASHTIVNVLEDSSQRSFISYKHGIRISPIGIVNPYYKGIAVGFNFSPHKHWTLLADYVIPLNITKVPSDGPAKTAFRPVFKFRGEIRHLWDVSPNAQLFLGLEGFMKQEEYHAVNGQIIHSGETRYYNAADVTKQVTGGGLLGGAHFYLYKHLFADIGIGIGFKTVSIERDNYISKYSSSVPSGAPSRPNEDQVSKNETLLYFPGTFGISYCFGKFRH